MPSRPDYSLVEVWGLSLLVGFAGSLCGFLLLLPVYYWLRG